MPSVQPKAATTLAREPRDYFNRPKHPVVVEKAEVKTPAEIAQMRTAGQLRVAQAPAAR